LWKKGGKGVLKNSKRRYFCLQGDHVVYSKSHLDRLALGQIRLADIISVGSNYGSSLKENGTGFQIVTENRIYELTSDSNEEMRKWVEGLNRAKVALAIDTPNELPLLQKMKSGSISRPRKSTEDSDDSFSTTSSVSGPHTRKDDSDQLELDELQKQAEELKRLLEDEVKNRIQVESIKKKTDLELEQIKPQLENQLKLSLELQEKLDLESQNSTKNRAQINKQQEKITQLDLQIIEHEKNLEEIEEKKNQLENQLKQSKVDTEKLTKERNQLIISNDQLTKEVEELKSGQGATKKTNDPADLAKIADYKNKLALLKHEYKKLKTEKDDIEKKYNGLLSNQGVTVVQETKADTDKSVSDVADDDVTV